MLRRFVIYGAIVVIFLGGIRIFGNQLIYFPESNYSDHPQNHGWPYEDIWLTTEDGVRIHAWWIGDPKFRISLLYFHGNAGNISHRLDRLQQLASLSVRFFLLDYRGYGESEGKPSEQGLYRDATSAYRYLTEQRNVKSDEIVLFGESIGGAVAVDLAVREPVGKVVLESTFPSLRELAKTIYPFVPSVIVPNEFTTLQKIHDVKAPIMIVHGTEDEIVPFEMGKRVFEAARSEKRFYEVVGAGHNDVYLVGDARYRQELVDFLAIRPTLISF